MKTEQKKHHIPKIKKGTRIKIVDKETGLNANEEAFVQKYIETNNATQSAIYAGYSVKSAGSKGCQLLKNIKIRSEINKRMEKLTTENNQKSIATAQDVMEYLTKVMRGEILDQFGLEAPLSERTRAAQELAKRTVDLENRANGKVDGVLEIKLDWGRDE